MKRLDTTIKTNKSTYVLFRRSENVAVYNQYIDDMLVARELFEIKTRPEETIKGVTYPLREVFAANIDFGVTAFSLLANMSDEEVLKRFEKFNKEINEITDINKCNNCVRTCSVRKNTE